jgi:hypothetical protein
MVMKKSLQELEDLKNELVSAYQTVLNAETPYEYATVEYAKFRAQDAEKAYDKALDEILLAAAKELINTVGEENDQTS